MNFINGREIILNSKHLFTRGSKLSHLLLLSVGITCLCCWCAYRVGLIELQPNWQTQQDLTSSLGTGLFWVLAPEVECMGCFPHCVPAFTILFSRREELAPNCRPPSALPVNSKQEHSHSIHLCFYQQNLWRNSRHSSVLLLPVTFSSYRHDPSIPLFSSAWIVTSLYC